MFGSIKSIKNRLISSGQNGGQVHRDIRRKRLRCELLQRRELMAMDVADVFADDLVDHSQSLSDIQRFHGSVSYDSSRLAVTVDGTPLDDTVMVHEEPSGGVSVTFVSGSNGLVMLQHFDEGEAEEIVFHAYNGDDIFQNFTSVASDVHGHEGDDTLVGGNGRDVLRGNEGDDDLFGNGGKDDLRGNQGDDDLHGGASGDFLDGGRGNDHLYGGDGPDQLIGGHGNDELFGENGRDSLFGDAGADLLQGDAGADRFLKHYDMVDGIPILVNEDTIADKSNTDVTVRFDDTASSTANLAGNEVDYTEGHWATSEIETIDRALAELVSIRRDNSFLLTDTGNEFTFFRAGEGTYTETTFDLNSLQWVESEHQATFSGWNQSGGQGIIYFADGAFSSDDWTAQTTFHEIAHEWDTENPNWELFKTYSSWTIDAYWMDESSGLQESTDGNWWHDPDASFARSYGMTNPMEDFATTYAQYMMDVAGLTYSGTQIGNDMSPKLDLMDEFITGS